MNFSKALEAVKNGQKISRAGWNGKGLTVQIQRPDSNSKMSLPYLYIEYPNGQRCPWLASQTDLLAEDWNVVTPIQAHAPTVLYAYINKHERVTYSDSPYAANQHQKRHSILDKTIQ